MTEGQYYLSPQVPCYLRRRAFSMEISTRMIPAPENDSRREVPITLMLDAGKGLGRPRARLKC